MTFIFWQGIISIHQKTFLEAVAKGNPEGRVILVVAEDITAYRKDMGWEVPKIDNVTIVQSPSHDDIKRLIALHKDAINIIGGIKVGSMLSFAFDECINAGCRIGIMTEPYNSAGIKGFLRTIKYKFYQMQYARYIQFVLAIGEQGVQQYSRLGYNPEIVFPWAYFVSVKTEERVKERDTSIRLIYAGRLEPAKGILRFVSTLAAQKNTNYTFDLYGTGSDEARIKTIIAESDCADRIRIYPFLKHEELIKKYALYNWVVLPSAGKDGWGVIVSEGLLNGLKVICSSICGASRVIKEGFNGIVFDWSKENDCANSIQKMFDIKTFETPDEITTWANAGISADAGAQYFFRIIDNIYSKQSKPGIPWEIN